MLSVSAKLALSAGTGNWTENDSFILMQQCIQETSDEKEETPRRGREGKSKHSGETREELG